jgi:hypothetical protein
MEWQYKRNENILCNLIMIRWCRWILYVTPKHVDRKFLTMVLCRIRTMDAYICNIAYVEAISLFALEVKNQAPQIIFAI